MSLRSKILGTVCIAAAAAFAASPALADFNGTLQGDYSNIDVSHGGGSVSDWGGQGAGEFGLGWGGIKLQVDGGYHNLSQSGASVSDWNVDGNLFWLGSMGRLGGTVGYHDYSGGGLSAHLTNYGGFGEWYAGSIFTLGAKGGGITANSGFGGGNGSYFGGEAVVYPMHDFALNGDIDYLSFGHGHITNYGATAEWLVSESTPISVYGGYTRSELSSGGGGANTWTIGLKFYLDENGSSTLVDRQRSGAVGWASQLAPIFTF